MGSSILDKYFTPSPILRSPALPTPTFTDFVSLRKQRQTQGNFQMLPPCHLFTCPYPISIYSIFPVTTGYWFYDWMKSPTYVPILFISFYLFKDIDLIICPLIFNYYFSQLQRISFVFLGLKWKRKKPPYHSTTLSWLHNPALPLFVNTLLKVSLPLILPPLS